jgi:hypothetical protein
MARIITDNLTPMQIGRLNKALAKLYRIESGEVVTLRTYVERADGIKREWDGMCDWSRSKFNRMTGKEQAAYEAMLKARRYYVIDGMIVPKIVYDACEVQALPVVSTDIWARA